MIKLNIESKVVDKVTYTDANNELKTVPIITEYYLDGELVGIFDCGEWDWRLPYLGYDDHTLEQQTKAEYHHMMLMYSDRLELYSEYLEAVESIDKRIERFLRIRKENNLGGI